MLSADSPLLWWSGFPIGFALTCVIELPAYLATFWALGWLRTGGPLSVGRSLLLGLAVNLITHPTLWLVGLTLGATGRLSTTTLGAAELGVVLIEGLAIAVVVTPGDSSGAASPRHAPRLSAGGGAPRQHVLLGPDTTRYPSLVGLACRREASRCADMHAPERRKPSTNLRAQPLVTRRPGWSIVVALGVNGLSVVLGLLVLPVVTAG